MDLLISPESQLITRVLFKPKELDDLETKGFDPEVLPLPYAVAFEEITRVRGKHGDMPSAKHLLKLAPDIQIHRKCPSKTASLYWEQIYRSRWRHELRGAIVSIDEMLPASVPDEALSLDAITDQAAEIFSSVGAKFSFDQGRPVVLGEMADTLRKEYEKLERGEAVGIPIPFEFLQIELVGWKIGRVYVVAGRPKTGKSWFALICGKHAIMEGHKVLFVSFEMTQEELAKRMACLVGGISYNLVVKGKLSKKDRKKYFALLEDLKSGVLGQRIKIVGPGQAKTPEAIAAMGKSFGATMIVVDAFYRMDKQDDEKGWEQIQRLMRRYGRCAVSSPAAWMLTTQFNRAQRGRGSAHLGNLAFGDAIGQEANGMVYLVRDVKLKKSRQVDLILGEAREADDIRAFRYNWNFITMDYSVVGAVEYGGDDSGGFG